MPSSLWEKKAARPTAETSTSMRLRQRSAAPPPLTAVRDRPYPVALTAVPAPMSPGNRRGTGKVGPPSPISGRNRIQKASIPDLSMERCRSAEDEAVQQQKSKGHGGSLPSPSRSKSPATPSTGLPSPPSSPSPKRSGGFSAARGLRWLRRTSNTSEDPSSLAEWQSVRKTVSQATDEVSTQADTIDEGNMSVFDMDSFRSAKIRPSRNFEDEYELQGELMPSCHRGMQVLNGTRKRDGQDVVVKVRVKKESFRRPGEEDEWRSTMEFVLNLPYSPHVCQLIEVLEDDKAYYIVMEKVGGDDLFESTSGKALLPMEEVREVVSQILVGIFEFHSAGRIHRDMKLENIMLDRSPSPSKSPPKSPRKSSGGSPFSKAPLRLHTPPPKNIESEVDDDDVPPATPFAVKIIDFDTVEECDAHGEGSSPPRRDVLGTDQYIAQEAYGGQYSPASDMFAIGVIAYRLVTGRFPYKSSIFDDKPGQNWVGSPKMREIQAKLRSYPIQYEMYQGFQEDQLCRDFVSSLLSPIERERPTAQQALQHPWLASSPTAVYFSERLPKRSCGSSSSAGPSPRRRPTTLSMAPTRSAPEKGNFSSPRRRVFNI